MGAVSEGDVVAVPIGDPQTPTDYYVVRVQLVHVRKGFFGFRDKTLAFSALVPDTRKEAADVFKAVQEDFEKRGVSIT